MNFALAVLVRMLIGVPVAFLVLMAFVWIVDRVFGKTDSVLELVQQKKLDAAERDLRDRLAVGQCEWLP
jgi:hypothetical protein